MIFLLSGEGPTDLGEGNPTTSSVAGEVFHAGPMAVIIDRVVANQFCFSILESPIRFVPKQELIQVGAQLRKSRKSLGMSGKKRPKETRYYFNNARALSQIAKEMEEKLENNVIAVLFRDADGTASADRGQWETKWQSMLDGFQEEKFERGVPMLPKPKSEAWLLCALKKSPYQNCRALEDRSGNDDSPDSLKSELETIIGTKPNRPNLCRALEDQHVNVDRIDMPTFLEFRKRLENVINAS